MDTKRYSSQHVVTLLPSDQVIADRLLARYPGHRKLSGLLLTLLHEEAFRVGVNQPLPPDAADV